MRALLRQRIDEWTGAFPNLELLRETSSLRNWALSTLLAGTLVALAAWVPFSSGVLKLNPWPALPAFAAAFALNLLEQRALARRQLRRLATLIAVGSAFYQMFVALLVASSSLLGAVLFGACLVIIAAFHGHAYRCAWRFPFIGVATLAACAAAMAAAPTGEHMALLGVLGLLAGASACLLGQWSVSSDRTRLTTERLRAAIQSQLVWEHSVRADRLAGSLEQVAQWDHDMRNALTSVVCSAKLLAEAAQAGGTPLDESAARATFDSMKRSLDVVIAGFEDLRRISRLTEASAQRQGVAIRPIAETVVAGVRSRYPVVALVLESELAAERVLVYGGPASVHRIVENLVLNACEGDGVKCAHRVEVRLCKVPGAVRLEVLDDGPGFPEKLLNGPAEAFATTKDRGTGLGLHSVEQLVAASDGRIARTNRPGGGAAVVVELPMEVEAAPQQESSRPPAPGAADQDPEARN